MVDVPLESREIALITAWLRKKGLLGTAYLEAGCGDGFNLERFSALGMNGTGIDVSDDALRQLAKKKLPNTKLTKADFLSYKKKSGLIFMLNVLEHIKEDEMFLKKACSLLAPGGYFILSVPTNPKSFGYIDRNAGHYRRYDEKKLRMMLKKTGFVVEKSMNVGYPVHNIYSYLFNLLFRGRKPRSKSHLSGMQYRKGYLPAGFGALSKVAYPILSILIRIDRLFLGTKLGNNQIYFCRKM